MTEGPYHCNQCQQLARGSGLRDVTLNPRVMRRVITGVVDDGLPEAEKVRVERAAKCLHWDGVRLYLSAHGVLRRYPALVERRELVYDAAMRLGFPGGRRLRRLLA